MTDSPFLPDGRQFAWNSTTLGIAKECPRKYFYKVIQGISGKGGNAHLVFGGHYAKALERFHRYCAEGQSFEEARYGVVTGILHETAGWESEHPAKNRETLLRSVIWYLENFRDDPCSTVILSDGQPAVELPFRHWVAPEIMLCGHLDRLVSYSGEFYVQDQKTTGASIGSWYFNRFNPDNQMSLYSIAARVIYSTPVQGVMIDAAQIAVGFTRFERGFTHRTDAQLQEWLADAVFHIENIWRCGTRNHWPMNDKACQLYGGCEFLTVCSRSEQVREDYLRTGFEKHPINPLEVR